MKKLTFQQKLAILIALLLLLFILVGYLVMTYFQVTEVTVTGSTHYTEAEIADMVLKGNILDNSILLSMKYRNTSVEDIPFVETMDVDILGRNEIKITVYEKSIAGCVLYLGNYMYFDREGMVVESSSEPTEGVPQITGLSFTSVQLYEQLPVADTSVFSTILELSQLLEKYEISPDIIYFSSDNQVTLTFGEARVELGDDTNINEKIQQLAVMVEKLEGKSGILDMRDFSESTTSLTFEPD